MYEKRNEILDSDSIHESVLSIHLDIIYMNLVKSHIVEPDGIYY